MYEADRESNPDRYGPPYEDRNIQVNCDPKEIIGKSTIKILPFGDNFNSTIKSQSKFTLYLIRSL